MKRLHASGLTVDDNGVIRPGENYSNKEREAEFAQEMLHQFTNKQRNLSDWAKVWKEEEGAKKQAENFEYAAQRLLTNQSVRFTSSSKVKTHLFPAFGEPLPYDDFAKRVEELQKEDKNLYSEGVAKNLGFDDTTFNLLKANKRSTAMGDYIHSRTELLVTALSEGFKNFDGQVADTFITSYEKQIEKELSGQKVTRKDFKTKEDFKIWEKLKNQITDYATKNQA